MRKSYLLVLVVMFLAANALYAGTTGKLIGVVKDASGAPLANAQVFIQELQMGNLTNEKGQYIIINIPPGSYTVICQLIGHQPQQVNNVKVEVDYTTTQNFALKRQSVGIEGITITEAKQELVNMQGNTSKTLSAGDIENIPLGDVDEIASLTAGVSVGDGELHARGGRANEVKMTVDGMSVSDPVDGGRALTIDTDAIANMNTMIGGITAEYGNAQSGVINIVTKSGTSDYTGKIEMSSDHIFDDGFNSDEVKIAIGGPVIGFMGDDLRKKLTFFFNAGALWYDGRYADLYESDAVSDFTMGNRPLLLHEYTPYDAYGDRDDILGFDWGDRNYTQYNYNLKTKYDISATSNVTFAIRGDINRVEPFNWSWRYAMEHYLEQETRQYQYISTYDHTFNPQTNLKVKLSYYEKNIDLGPKGIDSDGYFIQDLRYYSPEDGRYGYRSIDSNSDGVIDTAEYDAGEWLYQVAGEENARSVTGFTAPGSIYGTTWDDKTSNVQFRADLEYALNSIHGFKTGIEVISHHLDKNRLVNPWIVEASEYDTYLQDTYFDWTPRTDSNTDGFDPDAFTGVRRITYFADDPTKIEMITFINPGNGADSLRLYYDTNGEEKTDKRTAFFDPDVYYNAAFATAGERDGYKADPWQGAYYLQDTMEWKGLIVNLGMRFDFWYLGSSYKVKNDDGSYSTVKFDNGDRFKVMVSPRIGISHPISERDVIHFAYNYQNQLPQFQYIFTSASEQDAALSTTDIIVGNAALEPQITITYEVGLQHQIGEDYVFDITAYYKNIYNYVNTKKVNDAEDETVYWYQYISEDYGSARGININLQKMLSGYISGSVAYTVAWADGNNSDAQIQDENTNLREFPLDWDIRHEFNLNFQFTVQKDEEYYIPFTNIETGLGKMGDFNITFIYSITSGEPYTASTEAGTALETNGERMDYSQNTDLMIAKRFFVTEKSNFRLYLDIDNLFNHKNVTAVYPITGSPTSSGTDLTQPNNDFVYDEVAFAQSLYDRNPGNYSTGRTITLGMSFNW